MRRIIAVAVVTAAAIAGVGGASAEGADTPPADATGSSDPLAGIDAVMALNGELGDVVADAGHDVEEIAELMLSDPAARITSDGIVFMVEQAPPGELDTTTVLADAVDQQPSWPAPVPSGYAENGIPIHHSLLGAPWVIYLDFDGEQQVPLWRYQNNAFDVSGVSFDDDPATFNHLDEQDLVSRTWGRVAEDFIPFNIDVTTERPASIGGRVIWALVISSQGLGGLEDPAVMGIAPLNPPGASNFAGQQVLAYWDHMAALQPTGIVEPSHIADIISHEAGHMYGLHHDGTSTLEYYAGHGDGPTSWAPIMGNGMGRNVTQWAAGGYPDAVTRGLFGETQDDLADITSDFAFPIRRVYRDDDAGDDIGSAAALTLPAAGIIARPGDVDVYQLPLVREARIQVTPFRAGGLTDGGNLDVAFDVLDRSGNVVATSDPQELTDAALTVDLPLEQHYLRVRPSNDPDNYSDYGSLGQYTITATLSPVQITGFAAPMPTDQLTAGQMVPVRFSLTDPVAVARVRLDQASHRGVDPLAEVACVEHRDGFQHCNLKLPRDLTAGQQYSITAQIQDANGNWVAPSATGTNPLTFTLR